MLNRPWTARADHLGSELTRTEVVALLDAVESSAKARPQCLLRVQMATTAENLT